MHEQEYKDLQERICSKWKISTEYDWSKKEGPTYLEDIRRASEMIKRNLKRRVANPYFIPCVGGAPILEISEIDYNSSEESKDNVKNDQLEFDFGDD